MSDTTSCPFPKMGENCDENYGDSAAYVAASALYGLTAAILLICAIYVATKLKMGKATKWAADIKVGIVIGSFFMACLGILRSIDLFAWNDIFNEYFEGVVSGIMSLILFATGGSLAVCFMRILLTKRKTLQKLLVRAIHYGTAAGAGLIFLFMVLSMVVEPYWVFRIIVQIISIVYLFAVVSILIWGRILLSEFVKEGMLLAGVEIKRRSKSTADIRNAGAPGAVVPVPSGPTNLGDDDVSIGPVPSTVSAVESATTTSVEAQRLLEQRKAFMKKVGRFINVSSIIVLLAIVSQCVAVARTVRNQIETYEEALVDQMPTSQSKIWSKWWVNWAEVFVMQVILFFFCIYR
eukprot:Clim_evm2s65 gene=Clim_evmTU2s65